MSDSYEIDWARAVIPRSRVAARLAEMAASAVRIGGSTLREGPRAAVFAISPYELLVDQSPAARGDDAGTMEYLVALTCCDFGKGSGHNPLRVVRRDGRLHVVEGEIRLLGLLNALNRSLTKQETVNIVFAAPLGEEISSREPTPGRHAAGVESSQSSVFDSAT